MKKERKYDHPSINQLESISARLIELNRELEEKNRQLEQSELARKNMFSNVTHDLRAPVAAIRGAAERLSNEDIGDEERKKMIKIIEARTAALDHLIGELHFSMLIDQPEFSLKLSCLEIAPVLEEFFISMAGSGRLEGRKCRLNIPEEFATRTMVDPQYFLRVLDNLMFNALQHTEPGDSIELGCVERGDHVEIHIRDSGHGIPAGDLPYIFDRTFVGEGARTPGKSGGGLGLSIVSTIIGKHGGSVCCHSVYGEGATFTISMPSA